MKKLLTVLILAALLLVLCSCGAEGSQDSTSDKNKALSKAVENLSKANSFEYIKSTYQQSKYEDGNVISDDKSELKEIMEPLTTWGRTDKELTRRNGDHVRSVLETYRKTDKNQVAFYMRTSMEQPYSEQEPPLGDWEENIITDKEQIEMTLKYAKKFREAEHYLLRSNMESFRFVEETQTDGANTLRYDGSIDPSTAMEAYKKYLRDYYVQFNMVKALKDPTLDQLKKEITSGEVVELQSGIPLYAYAEEPVPISFWIDKETFELKKVTIDKTVMMQIYFTQELPKINPGSEVPVVQKFIDTYVIKGINTLKEIEKPE